MDAFAVAICIGFALEKTRLQQALIVGLYFGVFQAGMPLLGYLIGSQVAGGIIAFSHWIAFFILSFVGGQMMRESSSKAEGMEEEVSLRFAHMLPLALATSIDALAVGVSCAFLQVRVVPTVSFIGIVTLLLSMVAVQIGSIFGTRFKSRAQLVGGIILILIGLKILLGHLIGVQLCNTPLVLLYC
jgi:putative Mn2+ efflux pump MntP